MIGEAWMIGSTERLTGNMKSPPEVSWRKWGWTVEGLLSPGLNAKALSCLISFSLHCNFKRCVLFQGNTGVREGNGTPLQYSCLENPMNGGAWWAAVHGVSKSRTRLSDFTLTFHFHALEKEMSTHSSILAWRIPGMGEPDGLPSMGSHRVGHDWSDLAAAAAIPEWAYNILGDKTRKKKFSWPKIRGQ